MEFIKLFVIIDGYVDTFVYLSTKEYLPDIFHTPRFLA